MARLLNLDCLAPKVTDLRVCLVRGTRMGRRIDQVELIDYVLACLVHRFMDHGETLDHSAAFAEFWCHTIAEECAGLEVPTHYGGIVVGALLHVSSTQAAQAYFLYPRQ